ncbi:wax ester/triacylglycerol synthase domain-containing protein [Sphingomonas sp. MMS24-JH45]
MHQLSAQDASSSAVGNAAHADAHRLGRDLRSVDRAGFVRFKDILRFIEARLGGARSFRQRLVRVPFDLDHPYWIEDPEFDLEYHVPPHRAAQAGRLAAIVHPGGAPPLAPDGPQQAALGIHRHRGARRDRGAAARLLRAGQQGASCRDRRNERGGDVRRRPLDRRQRRRSRDPRRMEARQHAAGRRPAGARLRQQPRPADARAGDDRPLAARHGAPHQRSAQGRRLGEERPPRAAHPLQRQGRPAPRLGRRAVPAGDPRSRKRCPARPSTTSSSRSSAARSAPICRGRANCPRRR